MSNGIKSLSIVSGIICLSAALIYQANTFVLIQGYKERNKLVSSELINIGDSLDKADEALNRLLYISDNIKILQTAIAEQAGKLSELGNNVDPDLESKKLEAIALAAEIVKTKRLERHASSQQFIQTRLDSRDRITAMTEIHMEAQFGYLLREVGISGQRYHNILAELSRLQMERDDDSASFQAGILSEAEMRSLRSANSTDAALQSLLSPQEYNDFQKHRAENSSVRTERNIYIGMLQLTPNMSITSREMLAATYSRAMDTDYYDPNGTINAQRSHHSYMVEEALPALRAMYESSLEGVELDEAMRFLRSKEIESERNLALINAGVIN